jgi:hypothetical protein
MTGWFAAASRPQQKHLVPTTLHRAADQIAGKLKEPADHICRLDYAGTAPIKVLARSYAARMSLQFFAGGASFPNPRKLFTWKTRPFKLNDLACQSDGPAARAPLELQRRRTRISDKMTS